VELRSETWYIKAFELVPRKIENPRKVAWIHILGPSSKLLHISNYLRVRQKKILSGRNVCPQKLVLEILVI
jgi:hypothetical protein